MLGWSLCSKELFSLKRKPDTYLNQQYYLIFLLYVPLRKNDEVVSIITDHYTCLKKLMLLFICWWPLIYWFSDPLMKQIPSSVVRRKDIWDLYHKIWVTLCMDSKILNACYTGSSWKNLKKKEPQWIIFVYTLALKES